MQKSTLNTLTTKQKMIHGIIWLAAGILLIFLCLPGKHKVEITKSITIENGKLLKIVLDDTNEKKCIGDIKTLYYGVVDIGVGSIKHENGEIIILSSIIGFKDFFHENEDSFFKLAWPGGRILIFTKYSAGKFEIIKEGYVDRI